MKFAVIAAILFAPAALADIPSPETIQQELSEQYRAPAPSPPLNERGPVARRIEKLLSQQARWLVSTIHPWQNDPRASLLTKGGSIENEIRPNAHTACGLAMLARCAPDDFFTADFTRQVAHDRAIELLRFLLPTHGAGGQKCRDGKHWHNQWQSALWAFSAGQAAWLLWDDLDPQMRWLAARMICDEADRFVDREPDARVVNDTAAEENAWNSLVISLAYCMFPQHPRHEIYGSTAKHWIISSFAAGKDVKTSEVVDGKPLKDWLKAPNIYDDYTLENHNRVHPDYMSTTNMWAPSRRIYDWAHETPPQGLRFNVENIYASCKKLTFPDGGYIYPNAQDWQLHRNADWLDDHADMAILYNDPQAARLMHICLETAEKMAARDPRGPIVLPHETRFASTEAMIFEWITHTYLLMRAQGEGPPPVSEEQLLADLAGKHVFEFGKFGILRTPKSVATFSWGRQIMGMVLPLQKDLLLTPNERSLIGRVSVEGSDDVPVMRQVALPSVGQSLAVAGIIERGKTKKSGPILEQRFGFVALADGRTVYVDTIALVGETKPDSVQLATIGVLNDKDWVYHDGSRTLFYENAERTFAAADAERQAPVEFESRWFNIEDRLGILCLASSGQIYTPKPTSAPGRLEQIFCLNFVSAGTLAVAQPNRPFAKTALVFYPGQGAKATREFAGRCKLESSDANHIIITLDDRVRIVFDLEKLTIAMPP